MNHKTLSGDTWLIEQRKHRNADERERKATWMWRGHPYVSRGHRIHGGEQGEAVGLKAVIEAVRRARSDRVS